MSGPVRYDPQKHRKGYADYDIKKDYILNPPNPVMIQIAREARGITTGHLARRSPIKAIGLDKQDLDHIESGWRVPTQEEIFALSKALHYPPRFFYKNGRKYEPIHRIYDRNIFYADGLKFIAANAPVKACSPARCQAIKEDGARCISKAGVFVIGDDDESATICSVHLKIARRCVEEYGEDSEILCTEEEE